MSENRRKIIYIAGGRSENDPTIIRAARAWNRQSANRLATKVIYFGLATSIFYWKLQNFAARLSFKNSPSAAPATKVTFQIHQVPHLPRKVTLEVTKCCTCPEKVTLEIHQTSPNTSRAMQKDSHALILVTYEMLFTLRGATNVILQPHLILLRLPCKRTHMLYPRHRW